MASLNQSGERHRVAVLPGDGIGLEVIADAVATLELAASLGGFAVSVDSFAAGGANYLATGTVIADDVRAALGEFDAILAGPFGDPRVPDTT